jgi:toxin ParE1/3/4
MRYKLSVKAAEDIEGIWFYTFENWSLEQADRYINLIFDEIEYISANPEAGKDCNHIRKNYRCSKVKSHLVFYRLAEKEKAIEIIRVLHERMDVENRLSD